MEQWKKGPNGCLGYLLGMKFPTQLFFGGIILKQTFLIRISSLNNQDSMENKRVFLLVLYLLPQRTLQAVQAREGFRWLLMLKP